MITGKLQNIYLSLFNTVFTDYLSIFIAFKISMPEILINSFYFQYFWSNVEKYFILLRISIPFRSKINDIGYFKHTFNVHFNLRKITVLFIYYVLVLFVKQYA